MILIRDVVFHICYPIKYRIAKRAHKLLKALLRGDTETIAKYSSSKNAVDFIALRLEKDATSEYYVCKFYHHTVSYFFDIDNITSRIGENKCQYSTEEILAYRYFDRFNLSNNNENIILSPYEESVYELLIGIVYS